MQAYKEGAEPSTVTRGLDNVSEPAGKSPSIASVLSQLAKYNRKYGQTGQNGVRHSIDEADQAYMSAVERGDMETADRMVEEAAAKAGYTIRAYHGTEPEFTTFDKKTQGGNYPGFSEGLFFFTNRKRTTKVEDITSTTPAFEHGIPGDVSTGSVSHNQQGDNSQSGQSSVRNSIDEADREYMAAVERGDTQTAQRMMAAAAEKAG